MPPAKLPEPLRQLAEAVGRLASSAPSSPVLVAQLHGLLPPDAFPADVREDALRELAAAHDRAAEPLPGKSVEAALKAAWGERPASVLDALDLEPVATTATSQVHRGELDGEAVAVKVRRPGVAEAIRRDLTLLDTIARPLGAAFPKLDVGGALRELRERVLDELDLEHEGSNQRRVARAFRRDPDVVISAVHSEHTTEDVLVSGWLDGVALSHAELSGEAAARVAAALVRVHLTTPRSLGLVLADPRPQDVLVLADGRVGLVDLAAAPAAKDRLDPAAAALRAIVTDDRDAFVSAAHGLGASSKDDARAAHALAREVGAPLLDGPRVLDGVLLAHLGERALDRAEAALGPALRATPDPRDLWTGRMLGQLAATLAHLGAEHDWPALALAALDDDAG